MKLSKNKVAGGVLGLLAIVSIVNTQAIVSLTNYVRGDSSSGMSLDGSNQSAQVVNFSTKITEGAVYKRGDKSDVILQVQKALTSKGLYKGDISGLMGPKTEKAISDFQKSDGLTVTGTLDQKTIDAVLRGGGSSGDTAGTVLPACTRNSEPWIRVLSPNGGEVYQVGEEINVTWRSCNISPDELLEINIFGIDSTLIFGFLAENGTPNDGSEIITQDWPVGTYQIIVGTPATPGGFNNSALGISDRSDNPFSIDQEVVEADEALLLVTNLGSSQGIYTDDENNSVATYTFLAKIKNTSNENIYIENSCGTNLSGFSVLVNRWVNNQPSAVSPLHQSCFVGYLGSNSSSNNLVVAPGEEQQMFLTYSFDPSVNFSDYGIIVDGINYRTPSEESVLTHLNIHPQSHPEANSWNDLVSDVMWVSN